MKPGHGESQPNVNNELMDTQAPSENDSAGNICSKVYTRKGRAVKTHETGFAISSFLYVGLFYV